jgi:hypothetical protein
VVSALGLASAGFTGLALYAAQQIADHGPDLAGIALVITATSGLIATVGALILGLRKKPNDPAADLARLILEREADRLRQPEDPA